MTFSYFYVIFIMVITMIKLNDFQKRMIRSIIVFLLFTYSAYWQYIPVIVFRLNTSNLSMSIKVLLSTFSSFITFFIFFFIYRKELKKEFSIFKKNLVDNIDVGFRYWLLGLIIMILSNTIIMRVFKGDIAGNEQIVQQMIKTLPYFMLLDAGFIAPFNEEITYRKTVKDVLGNHKWLFVILSGLLFGCAHVLGNTKTLVDYLYIIPYGTLGAAFALSYHKTNTVFTSITMHMFHNILLVLISMIA